MPDYIKCPTCGVPTPAEKFDALACCHCWRDQVERVTGRPARSRRRASVGAGGRVEANLPPDELAAREARIREYERRAASRQPLTTTRRLTHGR